MSQIKVDEAGATYERPVDFNPAEALPNFARAANEDETIATVRFDSDIAAIAIDQASDATEVASDTDSITIDLRVSSVTSFIGWMLGFDDKAMIVGPQSLVDEYLAFIGGGT
jgi:hypothetical protein